MLGALKKICTLRAFVSILLFTEMIFNSAVLPFVLLLMSIVVQFWAIPCNPMYLSSAQKGDVIMVKFSAESAAANVHYLMCKHFL